MRTHQKPLFKSTFSGFDVGVDPNFRLGATKVEKLGLGRDILGRGRFGRGKLTVAS